MTASAIIRPDTINPVRRTVDHRVSGRRNPLTEDVSTNSDGLVPSTRTPLPAYATLSGSSKTPRIVCPAISPEVTEASTPIAQRITSSARDKAASKMLSKSATSPPVIFRWQAHQQSMLRLHAAEHGSTSLSRRWRQAYFLFHAAHRCAGWRA